MLKYLLATVLCLSSIISFGTAKPEIKKAFKANVQISQETVSDGATCSGTAIGPHAILTATHCELPTDELEVSTLDKHVNIVGRIRDGNDHTIYLIDGEALKDFVSVAQNHVDVSDTVFIWGNPGKLNDIYRTGVFSGIHQEAGIFGPSGPQELLFNLQAYHGDSGAGIFTEDGNLVEVVSFTYTQSHEGEKEVFNVTGAYAMGFKDEDLARAVTFVPKDSNSAKQQNPQP